MWLVRYVSVILTFISTTTVCSATSTGGRGRHSNKNLGNIQDHAKGWLRVCNDRENGESLQHYEVEAEKCPYGAWLSESLEGGCVCLNGLWAISQSWCDEDYIVAYGTGDCFKFEMPIRKLSFLGDALTTSNFVTKENGHVFRSFSKEFTMPYEFSRETNRTLLRLRPNRGTSVLLDVKSDKNWDDEFETLRWRLENMMVKEEPICIVGSEKWNENELLIYKVNTGIKHFKVTKQCPQPVYNNNELDDDQNENDFTTLKVLPGQAIHVKSGRIIHTTTNCSLTCSTNVHHRSSQQNVSIAPIRHKRETTDFLELDREFTPEERDEIVRTSNLRVVKQELNWLLEGVRPPPLKSANWKLAQKVKEIFIKACPNAATPKFLVNAMMRLFRLFYLNSRDFYPNGHMLEEKAQNERMSNTLDLCLNDATELEFEYDLVKIEDEKCRESFDEDENETITLCKCKEVLGYINMTYSMNLTGPGGPHIVTGKDLDLEENLVFMVPPEKQFNTEVHDFPTETMWKVITFTHFYCAKYFQHNPADFSALMTKMEDFFNEDIIYRWTRPGDAAFMIWQYLYSAFDLRKFARSVDACVAASKFVSAYPEWLNRPTLDIKKRRKRSLDNAKLWKGSAYCLDDPWDPVYKLGVPVPDKCVDLNRY